MKHSFKESQLAAVELNQFAIRGDELHRDRTENKSSLVAGCKT